jgi:ketosteroid isomerase-like protein
MHAPYEKSAKDYIAFFNTKGFFFEKVKDRFEVRSIYTKSETSHTLPKRTGLYLDFVPDLTEVLKEQRTTINRLVEDGRDSLKNLWAGHLMEKGLYDRVAFMLTSEKAYPNLHGEMVQDHMDKGLRKTVQEAMARKSDIRQNRLLRKAVYAVSSLLGDRGKRQEEVYNGFKDELTDWSKYKGRGLSL